MSNSTNRAAVPEAKSALDRFKYEVASEIGVPLTDGYNGDLTSKQNGSVGGYMVKNMFPEQHTVDFSWFQSLFFETIMFPERHMTFFRQLRSCEGHVLPVRYTYSLAI